MNRFHALAAVLTITVIQPVSGYAASERPIRVHPENPHYLLWRGEPTVLITASEHYGAVMNLGFDYVRVIRLPRVDDPLP